MLNFGWVICATLLSVATTLLKFEIDLPGDDVLWGVFVIIFAYGVFFLGAIVFHHFIFGMVFVFYTFSLFLKYIDLIMENGKVKF